MLKPDDIEALRKLAADHDRGGFYLKYYELIKDVDPEAARHALREAEIATYSGPLGGAFFDASLDAKRGGEIHPGSATFRSRSTISPTRSSRKTFDGNRTFL